MMLETIVEIGKIVQQHPQGMQYHRYFNPVKQDIDVYRKKKDNNNNPIEPVIYKIPVDSKEDRLFINLEQKEEIKDEDYIKLLYTLNYKTSDRDSSKRYLYGDISYAHYPKKTGSAIIEENGNYRLLKKSSFDAAEEQAATLPEDSFIVKFRHAFKERKEEIEALLKSHPAVILHFCFEGGKFWYEQEEAMQVLKKHILESFAYPVNTDELKGFSLKKGLITMGVSEDDNKRSVLTNKTLTDSPLFKHSYQMYLFNSLDDIWALMYAMGFAETAFFKPDSNVHVVALPHGPNITADALIEFFTTPGKTIEKAVDKEKALKDKQQATAAKNNSTDEQDEWDVLFEPMTHALTHAPFSNDIAYDIVFISPKSAASPATYLLTIENLSKSFLSLLEQRIQNIKIKIRELARKEGYKQVEQLQLEIHNALKQILNLSKGKSDKLRNHFVSVLSKIYMDSYRNDAVLLPAFVDNVEQQLRDGKVYYHSLKYQLYLLLELQQNDRIMEIKQNPSYRIGYCLGIMARPFAAWRDDCPIKSFEKNYVGNLTRRIAHYADILKFYNFLNEKLTIHERMFPDQRNASQELAQLLGAPPKHYNKDVCALGFFEAYFQQKTKNEANSEVKEANQEV
ncbi:MAG: hypothetical protein KatS3mg087_2146 [Patescibacteria group bacterium]|uniref:hypothetical protein n=1 Tax=Thermonema sp. TaxID=2231181 RepID=UPI0021DDA82F|nr:hypothetical protein [Thermonema sp.]GIV39347.1 MAG: hypothetical protein KatS3mg033_1147 [Thermonema sp.]GIW61080.1 MAG: hypothetical protein KatS3mg087_2146 [Patescibacteria group bacterium]